MKNLFDEIKAMEFSPGIDFHADLNIVFVLLAEKLPTDDRPFFELDFNRFLEKGRFAVLTTFAGGILFLKNPEPIEKIGIESRSKTKDIHASVVYLLDHRNQENVKYKADAGKTESVSWNIELIFPHFFRYEIAFQKVLLLLIAKIVKRVCEYGRRNVAYMKIENEFDIHLVMDGHILYYLKVEIE